MENNDLKSAILETNIKIDKIKELLKDVAIEIRNLKEDRYGDMSGYIWYDNFSEELKKIN